MKTKIKPEPRERTSNVISLMHYMPPADYARAARRKRSMLGLLSCEFTLPCLMRDSDSPFIPNCPHFTACSKAKNIIL